MELVMAYVLSTCLVELEMYINKIGLSKHGLIILEAPQRSGLDFRHGGWGVLAEELNLTRFHPHGNPGGGISGSKADLTELPGSASPLQFGDWIHLCRPVMRDLSSAASRRWDLTVRQAQVSSLCGLEASHGANRPEDP